MKNNKSFYNAVMKFTNVKTVSEAYIRDKHDMYNSKIFLQYLDIHTAP